MLNSNFYEIKAICLTKLCSKLEVEITTIAVPVRFCLGIIKITTGLHPNSIVFWFVCLFVFDAIFCHKSIISCHNVTSITKQLPNVEP